MNPGVAMLGVASAMPSPSMDVKLTLSSGSACYRPSGTVDMDTSIIMVTTTENTANVKLLPLL